MPISHSTQKPFLFYGLFVLLTTFCEFQLNVGGNMLKWLHLAFLMFFLLRGYSKICQVKVFFTTFLVAIFLNCMSSLFFRGQNFSTSYFAYYQIWYLMFFYALALEKKNIDYVDTFLKWVILTVTVVYYIQLCIFPKVVWGNAGAEWVAENELYFRGLVVGGESAISLGYFYFFNKYLVNKNKVSLLLMIICAIPFFIRGYRIMITAAILGSLILYVRTQKRINYVLFALKIIIGAGLICGFILLLYQYVPIVQNSLDSLLNRSEGGQTFDNDDYIRIVSINYYYTEFFKNPIEMFLGAGMIGADGPVAEVFARLMQYNFNLTDWGLIGLSWYAGMPVVLCIIYYLLCGIFQKMPPSYRYVNAWFLYLLVISLTDPEMYQHYSFLIQSILLYILYLVNPHFLCLFPKKKSK